MRASARLASRALILIARRARGGLGIQCGRFGDNSYVGEDRRAGLRGKAKRGDGMAETHDKPGRQHPGAHHRGGHHVSGRIPPRGRVHGAGKIVEPATRTRPSSSRVAVWSLWPWTMGRVVAHVRVAGSKTSDVCT
jgi:hypothetical protein